MTRGRTVRTKKKMEKFLAALREAGTVTHACEAAGIGRRTAYEWREADPDFAAAWDAVIEAVADDLEQVATKRAREGSDLLLMFLLKGQRPEKYRERMQLQHEGKMGLEIVIRGDEEEK